VVDNIQALRLPSTKPYTLYLPARKIMERLTTLVNHLSGENSAKKRPILLYVTPRLVREKKIHLYYRAVENLVKQIAGENSVTKRSILILESKLFTFTSISFRYLFNITRLAKREKRED
jgi:hypothetical protein